jgi:hypothetical protein
VLRCCAEGAGRWRSGPRLRNAHDCGKAAACPFVARGRSWELPASIKLAQASSISREQLHDSAQSHIMANGYVIQVISCGMCTNDRIAGVS